MSGTVRLNLVEVGGVGLHPRLMTKHSPFSHMKPGPGFLHHLALARGPGTKNQGSIGQGSSHPRPSFQRCQAQSALVSFARSAVRGPMAEGYCAQSLQIETAGPWTGAPYPRAPRLGPRAFSIGLVNSFGGNFVWNCHLYSRTNFKLNRTAALTEWRQLLSA